MSAFLGPLDIHAQRIDNYGDAGWSWRLAREFAYRKTATTVRFFFDDLSLLNRMEPSLSPELTHQRVEGVEVYDINRLTEEEAASMERPDLLLEIFGTTPPERLHPYLLLPAKLRIQMEYLSAEPWAVESHLLPSPLGWGPARYFYFSGFSPESGGILLDSRLDEDAREMKADSEGALARFLQPFGLTSPPDGDPLKVFFFPYRGHYTGLIEAFKRYKRPVLLFLLGRESLLSLEEEFGSPLLPGEIRRQGSLTLLPFPFLPQREFDRLMALSDLLFVRGEDSLARAVQLGKPFLWQAYRQENDYQLVKVEAFLKYWSSLAPPGALESFLPLWYHYNRKFENEGALSAEEGDILLESLEELSSAVKFLSHSVRSKADLVEKFTQALENLSKGVTFQYEGSAGPKSRKHG